MMQVRATATSLYMTVRNKEYKRGVVLRRLRTLFFLAVNMSKCRMQWRSVPLGAFPNDDIFQAHEEDRMFRYATQNLKSGHS